MAPSRYSGPASDQCCQGGKAAETVEPDAVILCQGRAKNRKPCDKVVGHRGRCSNKFCPRHPRYLKDPNREYCGVCAVNAMILWDIKRKQPWTKELLAKSA